MKPRVSEVPGVPNERLALDGAEVSILRPGKPRIFPVAVLAILLSLNERSPACDPHHPGSRAIGFDRLHNVLFAGRTTCEQAFTQIHLAQIIDALEKAQIPRRRRNAP